MLVIFDWDGTLCDSAARIVAAMQAAAIEVDLPRPSEAAVVNIIGLGLHEAVERIFPDLGSARYEPLKQAYSHHFRELDEVPSPLYPGAMETMGQLKQSGYRLAVATGKSRNGLDRVLAGHDLADFFDASRCADETRSKPHPLMLHELLEELSCAAQDAVMVGDTEYDLAMAVAADMPSVGVSYGSHSRERLLQHSPLAVIDSLPELLSALG